MIYTVTNKLKQIEIKSQFLVSLNYLKIDSTFKISNKRYQKKFKKLKNT